MQNDRSHLKLRAFDDLAKWCSKSGFQGDYVHITLIHGPNAVNLDKNTKFAATNLRARGRARKVLRNYFREQVKSNVPRNVPRYE